MPNNSGFHELHYTADAEVAGCLFHFGQAQWRHVHGAGLAVTYREEGNEAMRTDFHALIALAFVPVDDVHCKD
ncbi:Histone-lysine N-methyltransferase 2B [Frankliniella fusca]|uniref:Histone-lysine N-methyltransferase 2B n=1 Tax=Frankliniella fusca TaxID=407009 RepID=A0AAE1HYD9_9NEOP|nr:Histone-lysine N-methyltransferase 2B [Frankliniella fusca]